MACTGYNRGTTAATCGNYGGTAAPCACNCGEGYGNVAIHQAPIEETPAKEESDPPKWSMIRTVLYVMLRLRYYVKGVARAPPLNFSIDSTPPSAILP